MLRSYMVVFLLASIALALAVSAVAETSAREACQADFLRFCRSVQRGGGRILQCLQSHIGELTPDCRSVVEERIAAKKK